ncbi:MAG: hypothetical protein RIG84_07190, partial [Roseovarius sp.]
MRSVAGEDLNGLMRSLRHLFKRNTVARDIHGADMFGTGRAAPYLHCRDKAVFASDTSVRHEDGACATPVAKEISADDCFAILAWLRLAFAALLAWTVVTKARTFFFGHSHLNAFYAAHAAGHWEGPLASAEFLHLRKYDTGHIIVPRDDKPAINPALLDLLREHLEGAEQVISVAFGNVHNRMAIVRPDPPFDFVMTEQPEEPLVEGYRVLPEGLIENWLIKCEKQSILFRETMREVVPREVPFFEILPIPPLPAPHVQAFPSAYAEAIERQGVFDDSIRWKIWRICTVEAERRCHALGIIPVPIPSVLLTADGMLRPDMAVDDPAHGNLD